MTDPNPTAAADPVATARLLGPGVALRSAEIEAHRTLPADLVADFRGGGLFRLFVPAAYGGGERHVQVGMDVVEELAYHDGSAGWSVMIAMTTGLLAAYLPPEHAIAVYGDPQSVVGGFAAPVGRAQPMAGGGLRVSGRWPWGSGTRHCTSIGGGCLVTDADGHPTPREDGLAAPFVFFDRADVELLDTWRASGLKGTGSTDYEVADAVVPEGRWVQFGLDEPRIDSPLYRFSFFGLLALGVTSVALGLARRAVDELVDLAATKRPQGSARPLAERTTVQAEVATAEALIRSSRALVADVVTTAWEELAAGRPITDEHRRSIRLAATHGTMAAAQAVDLMYTAGGGAAVYEDSPLQRVFRDAHVATQHAMTAPRTLELVGRMRLGLDTDTRQL